MTGSFVVRSLYAGAFLLGACATQGTFRDAPIVWFADDMRHIAKPSDSPEFGSYELHLKAFATRRLTRALEFRGQTPAQNTNALDEVPNSSWFTNRIGVRHVTEEEIRKAPVLGGAPVLPLKVIKGKSEGANPGFFAEDQRGRKFLVKFDTKENPRMQTATGAIANRLFWAMGYNVPSDTIFYFRSGDLQVGEGAKMEAETGKKRALKRSDLLAVLATSPKEPDGRYRALASELIPGEPVGGFLPEGTRKGDPNDTVPHEHRREVRGLRVFTAWLNHTDIKIANTLDVYVEENRKKFVRHYLIDFGEAFGAHAAEIGRLENGHQYEIDYRNQGIALFAFGLYVRPWEKLTDTPWLSVGAFSSKHFDPEEWREIVPYWPFFETTAEDAYWAAKIVMRFGTKELRAAVEEGQLSKAPSEYLVRALRGRARVIGKRYIEALSPLDAFRFESGRLCMHDLGVYFKLATSGVVEKLNRWNRVVGEYTVDERGAVCIPAPRSKRYTVERLRIRRGRKRHPVMQVHHKGSRHGRVLGVIRLER